MNTTDEVVERVRKLLRLAADAGATEAEAATALERASALLIRHNLTMDRVTVSVGGTPAITEHRVRTGWAGSWRGSLLAVHARHNLCSPIISRESRVDTNVVVGRPAKRSGNRRNSSASATTNGERATKSNAIGDEEARQLMGTVDE